jgi:hypothetical protein
LAREDVPSVRASMDSNSNRSLGCASEDTTPGYFTLEPLPLEFSHMNRQPSPPMQAPSSLGDIGDTDLESGLGSHRASASVDSLAPLLL